MAKNKSRKPNKEYTLIPADLNLTSVRVLGCDPGSRNFGISCVGVDKQDRAHVLANAVLTNPIFSLADNFKPSLLKFLDEIELWIKLYKPQGIVIERFQTRGGMGPLIEIVSGMNVAICTEHKDLSSKLITAATWKNNWHRRFEGHELDDLYKECLAAPHQLDASLIAIYGLEVGLRRQVVYTPKEIVRQVQATSLLPLRKPRN